MPQIAKNCAVFILDDGGVSVIIKKYDIYQKNSLEFLEESNETCIIFTCRFDACT